LNKCHPPPKTYYSKDIAELKSLCRQIDFPYIIKPTYAHLWNVFNNKCLAINSTEDLNHAMQILENKDLDVMIQDVIPGKELYSLLRSIV
jgi:predicted ATP-grasp superfamily ATP-dependent carboligase